MEEIYNYCDICKYKTKRKYNLIRHQNAIHKNENDENKDYKNVNDNCKNVNDDYKNVNDNYKNVNDNYKNVNDDCKNVNNDKECSKCSKILSSKYYLEKHLKICKGVSNPLECHICHKILSCYASKSNHMKTCRAKSELVVIKTEEEKGEIIERKEEQIINNNTLILNNCNNKNITYNINLVRFNEEELKIDFDIKHLETNNIIHKLYIIAVEDAYRLFYKKLFENKNNQMIIKKNLRHTYSKVHTGRNIWQMMLDDYIYHIIMHYIAETLIIYINNNTKNKENKKYKELIEYGDYMATKGYSCKNTKEIEKSYKNHIKNLKYLFNTFKDE